MRHKIVSLRKPIDARILETGVKGEYELYIQHETGVENLSGLSVRDMAILSRTIDCFLDDTKADVGLTDDGQSDTMEVEDSEVTDLLTGTIIDGVSDLLSLPAYNTVAEALHEYVVSLGLLEGKTSSYVSEGWERVSMDIELLNPHIHVYNTNEFAKTIQNIEDNGVALELLRTALDFQDSGSLCN